MKIPDWPAPDSQISQVGRHQFSVPRLLQLARDLTVMDIPLDHLYVYYKYDSVTLRDMVMHMRAVQDADLSYPIILDEDGELMDGRHRLMKAILLGHKTIQAVRFDENPEPDKITGDS